MATLGHDRLERADYPSSLPLGWGGGNSFHFLAARH
jgi:hypothetical protein